jgi:hypothetical protein
MKSKDSVIPNIPISLTGSVNSTEADVLSCCAPILSSVSDESRISGERLICYVKFNTDDPQ